MRLKTLAGSALLLLAAAANANGQSPRVQFITDAGTITFEIFSAKAPRSAANFLRYVSEKRYDGSAFYRTVTLDNQAGNAVKIEVIQGGTNGDRAKALPPIAHETTEKTGVQHTDGTLSMARAGVGTASSEFFITIGAQPSLDYGGKRNADGQGFAAFGRVVDGMDVVRAIQRMPTDSAGSQRLRTLVTIRRARVLRAQTVGISAVAGKASDTNLEEFDGLLGAQLSYSAPLTSERFTQRLGLLHMQSSAAAVGSTCSGLVLPGQCPPEQLRLRRRVSVAQLGAGVNLVRTPAIRAGLYLEGMLGLLATNDRGLASGATRTSSKGAVGATLGAEVLWWPIRKSAFGLQLGAAATRMRPISADDCVDCYAPFPAGFNLARAYIGIAHQARGARD